MSTMTKALFIIIGLGATVNVVDANAFLKANPSAREERISKADVQTSLLAEVEGTLGEGTASSRVAQMEATLGAMYAALPKNEQGYLGHATVRYALHRLFVQRHGWSVKGLDTMGGHRNTTTDVGVLKDQVPAYIQDLFEERLGGRGFGLHELAVLAATIEHLIHSETIGKLGDVMKVHKVMPTSLVSPQEADEMIETYLMAYIMGEDLTKMTLGRADSMKRTMVNVYAYWPETREFAHEVRRTSTKTHGSAEQKESGRLDFSLLARIAETVGEQFGTQQDQECRQLKSALVDMEEAGSGRVSLANFYRPALGSSGAFQFQENVEYLRELGALDEADEQKPQVIIANYLIAPSNCIASSSFYHVCCMDECEGLLGHLETQIAAPDATPARIVALVSNLSSSSVAAPRKLSANLLDRLNEIAEGHGGNVQLHGRLFSQWMHHAYPRECPYPHLSGTTSPQTPDEWLENTGDNGMATKAEMRKIVKRADALRGNETVPQEVEVEVESLPWSPEEELLVVRPLPKQQEAGSSLMAQVRNVLMFFAMTGTAYGLVHNSWGVPGKAGTHAEKYMV